MPDEVENRQSVTGESLAGVASSLVGMAVGGLAGPTAGAMIAAGLQPILERIADYDRRSAQNAARTVSRGAALAGTSDSELAAWSDGSSARLELLARVVEAAWRTLDDQKVEALARVLADGVRDDARLDLAPLFVSAITELVPAHVHVLRAMSEEDNPFTGPDFAGREWSTVHLREHLPHLADGMDYLVATLDRVGCIQLSNARWESIGMWAMTPFGAKCLDLLRDKRHENVD